MLVAAALPGDRSIAHASQPNASPDLRVTWYGGFQHRDTIREVWGAAVIEARKRSGRYPDEEPLPYQALGLTLPDSPAHRERALRTPALQV